MFDTIEQARLSELHVKSDEQSQLRAIIAIHNTRLGPALGGCRCIEYPNDDAAILDAVRLAKGMSYKAAMAGVPQGGGKAVLIRPRELPDRERYFEAFGRFVDELGGRYITAVDSGTTPADMDYVSHATPHVSGTSSNGGDPSPVTALGVLEGIRSCVAFKLGRADLEGVHVAIQGVGNVGYYLARLLHEEGARLTVTDIDEQKLMQCADEFGSLTIDPTAIYHTQCDVFAPCSLGAVLNDQTIPKLSCGIVAGSANNQLAADQHGVKLFDQGIVYAPDYVINAGGLIHVSLGKQGVDPDQIIEKTKRIGDTVRLVLERAAKENRPTNLVADAMAEEKLYH